MPEKTKPSNALPYEMDGLTEELRKRAKSELGEDNETRIQSLKLMKCMIKDEKDLDGQTDDNFLLAFLRSRKFEVKRAITVYKNFYTAIKKHPELYGNFNFSDVEKTMDERPLGFLPYRDQDGCVILIISTKEWDPTRAGCSLADVMRALTCSLLHAILSPASQVAGVKVIMDLKDFSFKHLPHVSPAYLWLLAAALQGTFPCRFRAVHIVNEGFVMGSIWSVMKQLLTEKIRQRIHFHGSNMSKLQKYLPADILPAEYEGKLPAFDNTPFLKQLCQKSEYINQVFKHGYHKTQ